MSGSAAVTARTRWWTPALIFVGASVLAALFSPSVSLWTDESVTITAAQRSLGELWAMIQRIDAVHGLYYAVMNVWVDVVGSSPFALRLPSALAAGGTSLGAYVLARSLGSERMALTAAVLCATLPRMTWGGIEARPFVFSALAATWATVLLVRALRSPGAVRWIAYAAVATVGVALNIYLVLVVVGHACTVIALARRERRTVLSFFVAAASVAVVSAPLLLLVRSQQAQLGGEGDRNPLSIARKILVNQFFLGETPAPDSTGPVFTTAWQAAAIIAAVLGFAAMLIAVLRPAAAGDRKRAVLAVTLPWILLPTLTIAAYAVLVAPIHQPRYFTFTAPAAALLMALGLRAITRRGLMIAGVVLYAACITVVFISQRTPFAKSGSDWSAVAEVIADDTRPGDAVFFAPRYPDQESVQMTTRRIAQAYPAGFDELKDLTLITTGAESATLDGFSRALDDAADEVAGRERVWALFNNRALPEARNAADPVFSEAGLEGRIVWEGPSTMVVLYESTG